jgi:hypothetical protein
LIEEEDIDRASPLQPETDDLDCVSAAVVMGGLGCAPEQGKIAALFESKGSVRD